MTNFDLEAECSRIAQRIQALLDEQQKEIERTQKALASEWVAQDYLENILLYKGKPLDSLPIDDVDAVMDKLGGSYEEHKKTMEDFGIIFIRTIWK